MWECVEPYNLVVVQMHGTYHRPDRGFKNHLLLELDGCTDLLTLLAALDAQEGTSQ